LHADQVPPRDLELVSEMVEIDIGWLGVLIESGRPVRDIPIGSSS